MLSDQEFELGFQVIGFGAQDLDASGGRPKGAHGRAMFDAVLGIDPQPGAALHLDLDGVASELATKLGWRVHDESLEVAQGSGPRTNGTFPGA